MPSSATLLIGPRQLLILGILGLSGCVRLGPDFQAPGQAWSRLWSSPALERASQRERSPDLREWWQVFNDPVLDR